MADITLPELGETVTEGTITKWFKQVGERVEEDEPLFEVSTDKVDTEVPSPASGWLSEIRVAEGDTVDVGTTLAVLSDSAPGAGAVAPAAQEPAAEPEPLVEPEPVAVPAAEPEPLVEPEPVAVPAAEPEPLVEPEPVEAVAGAAPPAAPVAAPGSGNGSSTVRGRLLSPVVRRLIEEHDLDPDQIDGTGVGGRITRADVLDALDAGSPTVAPAREAGAATAPIRPGGDTVVPFSNIRRRTAEHMVASKATSAHVITAMAVDYEGLERVRLPRRESWKADEGFSLTYLPFISRAVIDALGEYPQVNATVGDDELILHGYVNLGIAVDLDHQGLLAPVIRSADSKRLRAIAREIQDLAGRARSKQLSADEITGGTFTISNSGNYGTLLVAPIINQPQVAILSTDGISRQAVVVSDAEGNEAIAIHSVGNLTLSWDHRAFDGAYAAAFMQRLKQIIETRDWEQEM
ncbi:MAG: Dihydrolipoyllysine-residue succinyltransferase component of 2-oxoglutarate dehydrogenase complex [Acidimicrobiales bacterium]|nr:MAG: 2-oxo acid dehydrogenase subunit E2 [Actinomycetota bacterium]MBV6510097.1 Dihydrolipoyllysine-residue succinyltransferase component of 2-oxoglutarate dehydrogenase complex [Acidimicrobiales bacterium]RIK03591.1 MAG: dihydrolipoyllysine-residue succinyltransferase [Acidobacteriota bacterium]